MTSRVPPNNCRFHGQKDGHSAQGREAVEILQMRFFSGVHSGWNSKKYLSKSKNMFLFFARSVEEPSDAKHPELRRRILGQAEAAPNRDGADFAGQRNLLLSNDEGSQRHDCLCRLRSNF